MDIQSIIGSPFIRIKLVAFVHMVMIIFGMQGTWTPQSYLFYNLLFIFALFWSMECKESIDAVRTAALIDAFSIVFDIFGIVTYYPYQSAFSVFFAILNLVARPFTVILLRRELIERGGIFIGTDMTAEPSPARRSYGNIDRPAQSVPANRRENVPNMF